jgi:hypothetical protein
LVCVDVLIFGFVNVHIKCFVGWNVSRSLNWTLTLLERPETVVMVMVGYGAYTVPHKIPVGFLRGPYSVSTSKGWLFLFAF